MMKKQILILLIFCGYFCLNKANAQVATIDNLPQSYQTTPPTKSEIRMTPAQLEGLLRQIIRAKQKQLARNKTIQLQNQNSSYNSENAKENQNVLRKLDAIESALLQIKLRQAAPSTTEGYTQEDLQQLEKRMLQEIDQVKTEMAKTDQAPVILSPKNLGQNTPKNDSIYLLQLENEIRRLNGNMATIEKSVNQLSTDYSQSVKKEDLEALLKEEDITNQKPIPNNINTDTKNYDELLAQMEELEKKMEVISQMKSPETPPSNTEKYSKEDLQRMEKRMLQEMELVKSKINNLDQPTVILPQKNLGRKSIENDSTYILQLENKVGNLNLKLDSIQNLLSQLSLDLNQLDKKEDPSVLRNKDTIIIQNSINTIPDNINTETENYEKLLAQIEGLKKMMEAKTAESKESKQTNNLNGQNIKTANSIITSLDQRQVFFQKNSFVLDETARQLLNQIAQRYNNEQKLNMVITGYTDSSGAVDYNLMLSKKRAESVKNYLMTKGISPNKISTQSKGIDKNASDANFARRVEIELLHTNKK